MNTNVRSSLLALLTIAAGLSAQDKVDLKVAAPKKLALWFQESTKIEQSMDMGGQPMDVEVNVHTVLTANIQDVDATGKMTVELKVERIHGSMTVPMMGDIEFDSAKTEEDEGGRGMGGMAAGMTKSFTAMAGKSYSATVGTDGKVVELHGAKELVAEAKKAAGGMRGGMMSGASEDTLRERVEHLFGARPAEPVAVGGKWQRSGSTAMMVPVDYADEYTLTKVDGDNAVVDMTGTASKSAVKADTGAKKEEGAEEEEDENAAMAKEMVENMKVDDVKKSGTVTFSRKDGFVVSATESTSMKIKAPSPMGGDEMEIGLKVTRQLQRTTQEASKPKVEAKKDGAAEAGKKDAGK